MEVSEEIGGDDENDDEDADDEVEHDPVKETLKLACDNLVLASLDLDEEEEEDKDKCHCECKMFDGRRCIEQFSDKKAQQIRYSQ